MSNKYKIYLNGFMQIFLSSFFIMILGSSCEKFIDIDPPSTNISAQNAYNDNTTAASVLNGIYSNIANADFTSPNHLLSVSLFTGLSADELSLYITGDQTLQAYYSNELSANTQDIWTSFYATIFSVNAAIQGLTQSTLLTPSVKSQLLGEAKFIRAFCHFYLINLYDSVPLVTTTDYTVTAKLPRASRAEIYNQIVIDLIDAEQSLSSDYLSGDVSAVTNERLRPTKWAAAALLARVHLYLSNYQDAIAYSTLVIDNKSNFDTVEIDQVFLKNSKEAIWQLQPVRTGQNTPEAKAFVLPSTGPNYANRVYLNSNLLDSFEMGDKRREMWIQHVEAGGIIYNYPFKYKVNQINQPVSEYSMVLRLAEQYLIRAEANARQNNIENAKLDLNAIRARAGLGNTLAASTSELLEAIYRERYLELFTEWGDRWLNLKRTHRVDEIMNKITPQKGGSWQTTDQIYPIPATDILRNPNLTQNPAY